MDDTAQKSNVTDIWSTAGQGNQQDDQNQPTLQPNAPTGGNFGKPGLAGGGESGYSEDKKESEEGFPKTEDQEKAKKLEADKETLDLLEKARKREMDELAELQRPLERQKTGEIQRPQETSTSPEVGRSPEIPRSPEVQKSPEIHRSGVNKQQKESTEQPIQEAPAPPASEKILDKRTGKEKTHRVDINKADAVTKVADIKEQEFIERVEQEHIKSII